MPLTSPQAPGRGFAVATGRHDVYFEVGNIQPGAVNFLPPTVLRVSQINATERSKNEGVAFVHATRKKRGTCRTCRRG